MTGGPPYEAVACCVDRSEQSEAVEARASTLAEALGIPLWLVHVMKPAEAFTGGVTTRSVPMEELEGQLRGEAAA
jgi:K+-sensing histidine kinase KdpD